MDGLMLGLKGIEIGVRELYTVSYTHLTLPTTAEV